MNVLHIEDRRENRLLVRKLLEAKGFSVTDAADGLTGVELARTTSPDLILVDINIPGLDGYQVVTRLRGEPRLAKTPIVAITAEGDRGRALSLGFDGFISKPIKMASFVNQLRGFLAGQHSQARLHRAHVKVAGPVWATDIDQVRELAALPLLKLAAGHLADPGHVAPGVRER